MSDAPPKVYCTAHVIDVGRLSEQALRITIADDELGGYAPSRPAEALRLFIPPPGATTVDFPLTGPDGLPYWTPSQRRPMLRGFTVRSHADDTLTFDVMDRPDRRWATRLVVGTLVGVAGMRFGYGGCDVAGHHVLVGDRSALPAVAASLAGVPSSARATVVAAASDDAERRLLQPRSGVTVQWVDGHRQIVAAFTEAVEPTPDHLFVAGEVSMVAAVHEHAVRELGMDRGAVQPIVYWQEGLSADQRDPQIFERYQRAAAEGRDVGDPALVAELELTPVDDRPGPPAVN